MPMASTTVLTRETGHERPYGRDPYGDYATSERLVFPVDRDERYHAKMPTLGLRKEAGVARAYPARELVRAGGEVTEEFAGQRVSITYDPETQLFRFDVPPEIEVVEGYWFAWIAFHPQTTVFVTPRAGRGWWVRKRIKFVAFNLTDFRNSYRAIHHFFFGLQPNSK